MFHKGYDNMVKSLWIKRVRIFRDKLLRFKRVSFSYAPSERTVGAVWLAVQFSRIIPT